MPAPVPCATCATAPKASTQTVLVAGPPCAGKTSYVADRATADDLVVDFDTISQALGSPTSHGHPDHLKPFVWDAVDAIAARLETGRHDATRAWFIKCAPDTALADRLGARIVVLETPADECKRRAADTGRPDNWDGLIDDWWSAYEADRQSIHGAEIVVPEPRDGATPTTQGAEMAEEETTTEDNNQLGPFGRLPADADSRDGDDKNDDTGDELSAIRAALKKANKEAETSRRRLKEIEDRDKTEQQKLAEKAAGLEATATAAQLKALRYEVALEKGLPKSLAVRLQGQTVEEMQADADELMSTIAPKQRPPSFDGGPRTPAPGADDDMTSRIRQQLGRT